MKIGPKPAIIGFRELTTSKPDKPTLPENITSVVTDQEVTYYRWIDENGQTHFSNTPPTGLPAEQHTLRPDTNIVQAVKVPEQEEESDGPSIFTLGSGGKDKDATGQGSDDERLDNNRDPQTLDGRGLLIGSLWKEPL